MRRGGRSCRRGGRRRRYVYLGGGSFGRDGWKDFGCGEFWANVGQVFTVVAVAIVSVCVLFLVTNASASK